MQLRDNIPGIVYPGCWGFFGGHLEAGETPEVAVKRELEEEIGYVANYLLPFDCYDDQGVVRHVFHEPLSVGLPELVLQEGWDMGLLDPAAIRSGRHYSAQAGEERPLASIHQKILLDFIGSGQWQT
jgi:8-oxo-dGTP diphosphatase